ncbi:MAG: PhoH family protein [Bacteroidota bacterium]|nr:PhoH family protein [Bacteroidota bacterium]
MIEKQINIHPKVQAGVFGRNDVNYKAIKTFFPKMKFVLRGDVLKFMGDESSVKHFAEVWDNIITYYENFNQLPLSTLNDILNNKYKIDSKELAGKEVLVYGNKGRVIKARTKNQLKMVTSIQKNDLLFAVGPAGSGKTYTAVALAVKALKERVVKKIILTRPAVEAGENLGFLPGDLKEKLDPYLQPLYDALRDMIPSEKLSEYLESGVIQIAPLGFMRGRTLDQAFVILDEGQNTTQSQIKMFLTRMGRSAKFIVTGDVTQVDLPKNQDSGLKIALNLFKNHKEISIVKLDEHDVIRHQLVKTIINAFNEK